MDDAEFRSIKQESDQGEFLFQSPFESNETLLLFVRNYCALANQPPAGLEAPGLMK